MKGAYTPMTVMVPPTMIEAIVLEQRYAIHLIPEPSAEVSFTAWK